MQSCRSSHHLTSSCLSSYRLSAAGRNALLARVALIGLAGVILSRYTLGRSFSIAPKATALVTSGIYSRIRNPIYISGMIFLIGVVLIVERPKLLAILLVLIPVQIVRARREAVVLEAKFGDAYREYRKRTWF